MQAPLASFGRGGRITINLMSEHRWHWLSIGLDGNAPDTPALVRRLVESGAAIERVEREEPSLEQVYLRLMTREERR